MNLCAVVNPAEAHFFVKAQWCLFGLGLFIYLFVCWGLSQRLCICQANALSLGFVPIPQAFCDLGTFLKKNLERAKFLSEFQTGWLTSEAPAEVVKSWKHWVHQVANVIICKFFPGDHVNQKDSSRLLADTFQTHMNPTSRSEGAGV